MATVKALTCKGGEEVQKVRVVVHGNRLELWGGKTRSAEGQGNGIGQDNALATGFSKRPQ